MKIGLFFGSFNPIHIGHTLIANYMKNFTELDEVWFIVSPQNPFKSTQDLINAYDRLEMVRLGIEEYEGLEAKDIEFHLPTPSYTIDTLTFLEEKYPEKSFFLIMGEDNLATLHKWKNYQKILDNFYIYVYPRFGDFKCNLQQYSNVQITNTPRIEISSTFLRTAIAEQKNIEGFVSKKVLEFIDNKRLYL